MVRIDQNSKLCQEKEKITSFYITIMIHEKARLECRNVTTFSTEL